MAKEFKELFSESPGLPFAATFMILLVIAAAMLALGNEDLANRFAEVAYYNLVIAVILQLIAVVRESRRSRGGEGEGSENP